MDKYVVFIPVRGGSKSIPLKNIRKINGRPLVYWTLDAAVNCPKVDRVYLCTDSAAIKEKVNEYIIENDCAEKLLCIDRPAETATDTASTESAMLYFANTYTDFEQLILVQATSPLLTADDLTEAIISFEENGYDSLLSVVRQKRFNWMSKDGEFVPTNYDFRARPRRQEFDGYLVENGAFYINSRENFLRDECRLSGKVGVHEMAEETYFEIDEPSDWIVIEHLLKKQSAKKEDSRLSKIRMLLTDCDGCLTDGGMYYSENGDELKKFNTKDGMGIAMLRENGIKFGIITGEKIGLVQRRALKVKADECHIGISNKMEILNLICEKYGLKYDEIAYIGDDRNDAAVIEAVGFGCSVADGMAVAQNAAVYITKAKGGEGAIREVAEMIIANIKK